MTKNNVTINFKGTADDRERLRILAARARTNQSEFMRLLIENYGEALVQARKVQNVVDATPANSNGLSLCWLTDGDELFASAYFNETEFADAQLEAYDITGNNSWWVKLETEPDIPRAYGFKHIPPTLAMLKARLAARQIDK
jgi:hypothetical protein